MKLLKYWRWYHPFRWLSEPREGLAIVRQRRYLRFSFLTKSIGPVPAGPNNRTPRPSALQSSSPSTEL